jgi:hypothetical protein
MYGHGLWIYPTYLLLDRTDQICPQGRIANAHTDEIAADPFGQSSSFLKLLAGLNGETRCFGTRNCPFVPLYARNLVRSMPNIPNTYLRVPIILNGHRTTAKPSSSR